MKGASWPVIRIDSSAGTLERESPFPPIPAVGAIVPAVVGPTAEAEVQAAAIVATVSLEGD